MRIRYEQHTQASTKEFDMHRASQSISFILLLFLSGCGFGADADPYSKRYSALEINAKPAILNETLLRGSNLDGLRLENLTLRNAAFMQTVSKGAVIRNVVFENCRFINAVFDQATLENVTFRGGLITCKDDADNLAEQSKFTNSTFTNVLLDGASLDNALFQGKGGSITLRGMHNMRSIHPIVQGENFRLTLNKCIFRHMTVAEVTGDSTLQADDCIFEYAYFGNSSFKQVSFVKCVTYGGPVYVPPAARKR